MTRPASLSGFPEFLPEQRLVELHVIDTLRRTFELHGFAPIETRAVEPLEQLLRKGEIDKEVYVLRRLQAASEDESADAGLGLHFDLTVPFARYVLENAGKLDFPFRRYQIQKVWRGERPQEGRYREFTQADIDVVGTRRAAVPPRRRGRARDGRGAVGAAGAGTAPAGQQPQADRGLLPRHRRSRHPRRHARRRQDGQGAGRCHREDARRRRRAVRCAGAAVPGPRRDPHARLVVRRPRARTRGVERPARRRGQRARGRRGRLREPFHRTVHRRGRPAHRPRPRLLHRHGVRDPHGRVRVDRIDLLGRALRLARQRRQGDLPRRGHLARHQPDARAAVRAWSSARFTVRTVGGARRVARRGVAAALRRHRAGAARARHPRRGGTDGAEVRPADPIRRTARHPVRVVPVLRRADSADEVKDIRSGDQVPADPATWQPPAPDLHPQVLIERESS